MLLCGSFRGLMLPLTDNIGHRSIGRTVSEMTFALRLISVKFFSLFLRFMIIKLQSLIGWSALALAWRIFFSNFIT